MTRDQRTIRVLILLLVLSTCFTLYALLAKKNTAAPVFLFMYDKQRRFLSEDSLSRPEFWDNYPYYVLLSMHKSIHLTNYVDDKKSKSLIEENLKAGKNLFYRFNYNAGQNLAQYQTIQTIIKLGHPITILTDHSSLGHLNSLIDSSKHDFNIVKATNLPIYLEKPGLSYFFRISKSNTVIDLFVPRKELPEVTGKYIAHIYSTTK